MPAVLVLSTSSVGPIAGSPTGGWVEEIAAPVAGGEVPWDEASTRGEFLTSAAEGFLRDEKLAALWRATPSAKEVLAAGIEQYDALYLPGGHGAMLDLAESDEVKALVEAFWSSGRVVAAVCHGPAGLVNAVDAAGAPIVKGRRVTAFTNSEEEAVGKDAAVPFMLETRLVELGSLFQVRDDWASHVVVDGQLITGQNPQSSFALAQAVAGALAPHAQILHEGEGGHKRAHGFVDTPKGGRDMAAKGTRKDVSTHPQAHMSQWHEPIRQTTHTSDPGSRTDRPDRSYVG